MDYVLDAAGNKSDFSYDLYGRRDKTLFDDGSHVQLTFNDDNELTREVRHEKDGVTGNFLDFTTEYLYHDDGRLHKITRDGLDANIAQTADNLVTQYVYDYAGGVRTEKCHLSVENRPRVIESKPASGC